MPTLSKSRFLAGLQCPLRLWHQCYNPELASEVPPARQAIFDTGHEVGRLATRLYPEGLLIEEGHLHHETAVHHTRLVMQKPEIDAIYEAAFLDDNVRVRVDILQRNGNERWNLIEVKSSTSLKDVYLPDVAIQHHVLKRAGLDMDRVILMHLNNRYVYDGKNIELEHLFCTCDMTRKVLVYENQIPSLLADLNEFLERPDEPNISPGRHCRIPYECEFWGHCTKDMPEHWVMELAGISQRRLNELTALGIRDIREVPDAFPLTAIQDRIRASVKGQKEYLSPELGKELKSVEYPVHFIDFETVNPAIPRYALTRPYQIIPFQWSDHILYDDGTIEHLEYLSEEDRDPREAFAETLLDALGGRGQILTYSDYENKIIKSLMGSLPQFCDGFISILPRFRDLCKIIQRHYYHPDFHGSFSLKSDMTYTALAIQEGAQASLEYLRMIDPSTPPAEKQRIKQDLLVYCGYDTLAMVKIRDELTKRFF
jgi:hypothetical protein